MLRCPIHVPRMEKQAAEKLRTLIKEQDLPLVVLHSLRHTFATTALQNGVDVKTVSSMLGRYDAGFTLRTYTHATRQMQDSAAEKMGNFMERIM